MMPRIKDPKMRYQKSEINAKKMHQARLANSIELPVDNMPFEKCNVGCSGWFYWHWRGKFYPEDLSTSKWFSYYTNYFNTVELNAPFYNWPTLSTVKTWVRQAKSTPMVYSIKVSEIITHLKQFKSTTNLIKDFYYIAKLLGNRMGCFLFQLPPSYQYSKARLASIVKQLDPGLSNVVEFRHESWWNEEVYKAFEQAGITFCSSSSPKLPDELIKTSDEIYLRFHGKTKMYRYDYSKQELQTWVERIQQCNPKRIWVYFNNDFDAFALKNAKQFIKLYQKSI